MFCDNAVILMQNKTFGAGRWGRARPGRPPLTRGYVLYSVLIRMSVWPSVPTFKYSNDILAFHLSRHQRLIVSATQSHAEKDFMCELTLSMGCDTESVKPAHTRTQIESNRNTCPVAGLSPGAKVL